MYQRSCHTKWECPDHLVGIPKYCKKKRFQELRKTWELVFRDLANQKECEILGGHVLPDHGAYVDRDSASLFLIKALSDRSHG